MILVATQVSMRLFAPICGSCAGAKQRLQLLIIKLRLFRSGHLLIDLIPLCFEAVWIVMRIINLFRASLLGLTIGATSVQAPAQETRHDLDFWINDDFAWGLSFPVAIAQLSAVRCNDPVTAVTLEVRLVPLAEAAGLSGTTTLQALHDEQGRCCRPFPSHKWDVSEPCDESEYATQKADANRLLNRTADRIKRRSQLP
jgi:hypothetical protein